MKPEPPAVSQSAKHDYHGNNASRDIPVSRTLVIVNDWPFRYRDECFTQESGEVMQGSDGFFGSLLLDLYRTLFCLNTIPLQMNAGSIRAAIIANPPHRDRHAYCRYQTSSALRGGKLFPYRPLRISSAIGTILGTHQSALMLLFALFRRWKTRPISGNKPCSLTAQWWSAASYCTKKCYRRPPHQQQYRVICSFRASGFNPDECLPVRILATPTPTPTSLCPSLKVGVSLGLQTGLSDYSSAPGHPFSFNPFFSQTGCASFLFASSTEPRPTLKHSG